MLQWWKGNYWSSANHSQRCSAAQSLEVPGFLEDFQFQDFFLGAVKAFPFGIVAEMNQLASGFQAEDSEGHFV